MLVAGGDGDGFSIGGGHVPHAIRRNLDITYIVMDNQIYGSDQGPAVADLCARPEDRIFTDGQPRGPGQSPALRPRLRCAVRGPGHSGDMEGLAAIIEEGIRYPGFAFINVQSPCVTYGLPDSQLKAQKEIMQSLKQLGHDPSDRLKAMDLAQDYGNQTVHGCVLQESRARRRPTKPASARGTRL